MEYGIYIGYWAREWSTDYDRLIDKAADLGFDILEISCGAFDDRYTTDASLKALAEHASDRHIRLTAGYGPSAQRDLSSDDPAISRQAEKYYAETFRKLSLMDITIMGGGLYSHWPVDYAKPFDKQKAWATSVEHMKGVADIAGDYGIVLGMEVLNRFEGYLLNTCREAKEYVRVVDKPNVGIMLDTFHMNIEEDSMGQAIRLAGKDLCHFHVGEQNRRVPGKGRMPWAEIAEALTDIGYDKAVVMEPFVVPGGTVGSDIRLWRPMLDDASERQLDDDAKGALQFLRHRFSPENRQ